MPLALSRALCALAAPALLLATVLALLTGLTAPATAVSTVATANGTTPLAFGLVSPGLPKDFTALDQTVADLGREPDFVTWYVQWSWNTDFNAAAAAEVASRGATPIITWEPWDPTKGVDQPDYSLAAIASGTHDAYIKRWALQIKKYAGPVILRPMHEMNGSWYPWANGVNGNTRGQYGVAWRHIVDVFKSMGTTNVRWEWSPNVESSTVALSLFYPGNAYVDLVGVDGYNWGTSQSWSTWQSFSQIFAKTFADLQTITPKPLYVAETGSVEQGGDKAAWVSDMFAWLALHPEVAGINWFDMYNDRDNRIESSTTSLTAFRAALA